MSSKDQLAIVQKYEVFLNYFYPHVYAYVDLVNEPGKTMDGIYDFLGVERFTHDFSNLPGEAETHSGRVLGVPDFHAVRPVLAAQSPDPAEVLTDYGMARCQMEDFWTP